MEVRVFFCVGVFGFGFCELYGIYIVESKDFDFIVGGDRI